MILVIGHILVGFVYLIIKLSPRKKDSPKIEEKEDKDKNE